MTKEKIIDGVDVAGCVQLVEEPNYPCGLGGECKGWENCYYKQLKRLEEKYDTLTNKFFNSETDKTRLKQENEKLKQQLEIDKNQINYFIEENKRLSELTCVNCGEKFLSPTGSELYEEKVQLKAGNKKLLHTLQEIKEIAEIALAVCDDDCGNANKFTEILDLITKTEEE